jgi:hypothetical protein
MSDLVEFRYLKYIVALAEASNFHTNLGAIVSIPTLPK